MYYSHRCRVFLLFYLEYVLFVDLEVSLHADNFGLPEVYKE